MFKIFHDKKHFKTEKRKRGREGGREGKRSKKSKCLVMEIRKEIEKARHRATKARSCRTDRLSPQKG